MTHAMGETGWRRGAVVVPILAKPSHGIVFVERAQHLRRHAGQIAFPGGTAEPSDAGDAVRTALRELEEEIGVARGRVNVVGRLADVRQRLNRFVITPIVGVLDANTQFSIDGREIASVFAVPFDAVVADGAVYVDEVAGSADGKPMYAFDYEGRHVWGLTGRVLKSFVDAWNAPPPALRDAIEAAWGAA